MKVIAWMGNHTDERATALLFAAGKVLEGIGPSQREALTPPATTIGAIREEWGDDDVALDMPADTVAWLYGDAGQLEFIVAEVQL